MQQGSENVFSGEKGKEMRSHQHLLSFPQSKLRAVKRKEKCENCPFSHKKKNPYHDVMPLHLRLLLDQLLAVKLQAFLKNENKKGRTRN